MVPPLALPLLRNLLQEPVDHRLPLPYVPRLFGYAFEFSVAFRTNADNAAMGITFVYQAADPTSSLWSSLPYFAISFSLNVLLTLMIVIRLILHTRNIRSAMGTTGSGGFYKAVITMFIESCALYAVTSLLIIGLWVPGNHVSEVFLRILGQTQVRASPHPRFSDS